MAQRELWMVAGLSVLAACAIPAEEPEAVDDSDQYLVRSNKVALNKVALNKVALNKVALNAVGVNKVALNKVALNKVALNQATLDLPAPAHTLVRVDINWDGAEYDVRVTRRAADGTTVIESNDEGISFRDVSSADLVNMFEKSARCLNPLDVPTAIYVDNVLSIEGFGMFALSSRDLSYRQYIEGYMACMAVWANDQSVLINVTAELPPTGADVRTHPSEYQFSIPAESVAYRVELRSTVTAGVETYVELEGRWLWNMSRHQAWSASYARLLTWFPALGQYDRTTNRACLQAALQRQPMPAICGGEASEYWPGPLTSGLRVPSTEGTNVWCTGRLGSNDIDRAKGTLCNTPRGDVSTVFYADLLAPSNVEETLWKRIIAEMSATPPTTGKGSGSGSGSGNGDGS